jgi:hypothetical protein
MPKHKEKLDGDEIESPPDLTKTPGPKPADSTTSTDSAADDPQNPPGGSPDPDSGPGS